MIIVCGIETIWRVDVGALVRNGPTLERDVIYAHGPGLEADRITAAEIEQTIDALRVHFPARDIWLYQRDKNLMQGKLTRA